MEEDRTREEAGRRHGFRGLPEPDVIGGTQKEEHHGDILPEASRPAFLSPYQSVRGSAPQGWGLDWWPRKVLQRRA